MKLRLERLCLGGDAIGRSKEGLAVFVPYGAPGEDVHVHHWQAKKNFARAWIQNITSPSKDRVDPPCPYFFTPGTAPHTVCGGCDWQHLAYSAQLKAKKELLIEAFQKISRIAHPPVDNTIGTDKPTRYRNKVQIPFASSKEGQLKAGFFAPGTHQIVPFEDCLVQGEESIKIFNAIQKWLRKNPVQAYHRDRHNGWLRHILIRTNSRHDALVAVISNGKQFHQAVSFSKDLTQQCPAVKSIFHNINTKPGNVILGPEWRHLYGKHYLTETVLGLRFRLSPGAFFQVHHAMAEKLYQTAVAFSEPNPKETVLELYAGVGAIGQLLASKARYVWCVEENEQAVKDAIESPPPHNNNKEFHYSPRFGGVLFWSYKIQRSLINA